MPKVSASECPKKYRHNIFHKNLKLDDYRHKSYISYPFSKTIFRFSKLDISTDPKMSIFQILKILLEKIPQNI